MCRLVTPPDFCNASESCNRVVGRARGAVLLLL
jgi:hypothetical protein